MRNFYRSETGNFAMMTAVMLPMLLASAGLAIDTAHIISSKSRLQNITDAAVLAASRENASDADRNALFSTFITSQVDPRAFENLKAELSFHEGTNYVEVTGQVHAEIPLYLMNYIGREKVSVSATTFRSTKTLEIAMVLDNTGSMEKNGIAALKKAAHALLNAVQNDGDPRQDVRMGLVPFVTAVNIKSDDLNEAWIDGEGKALYNGWNFISDDMRGKRPSLNANERATDISEDAVNDIVKNWAHFDTGCSKMGDMKVLCGSVKKYPHHWELFRQSKTTWKGCVEARPVPYNSDLTVPDPSNPNTLFVPYFAPSEPHVRMTSGGNDGSKFNNAWLDHKTKDLNINNNTGREAIQRSTIKYVRVGMAGNEPVSTVKESPNLTLGPNRACPTPIVPLTEDMKKVRDGIDAMQFWNGSGTNIAEGLAWGWRLLSPDFFSQAAKFDDHGVSKFLVLMSDGTNTSFGASGTINKSDYGSYGFLNTGRIDGKTDQKQAAKVLDGWTGDMCKQMKSQKVEVFTVLYNTTNTDVTKLFQECASRKENFHRANNTAALEKAFSDIGNSVARLHLKK